MRILFLSRWFPYPADNGSKIRILGLVTQLARVHEVTLLSFREPDDTTPLTAYQLLADRGISVREVPYRPYRPSSLRALAGLVSHQPRSLVDTYSFEMQAAIEAELGQRPFDLLIASQLDMAPYALAVRNVPAILEELELAVFEEEASAADSAPRRWRSRLMWLKLVAYIRRILPRFHACTVVSGVERARLRKIAPEYSRVHVIPNGLDLARYQDTYAPARPNSLVYAGALTYSANYDAVAHFLRDVYPSVLSAVPEVVFRVTGRNQGVDLNALPRLPGVEYAGPVPDVRPVVAESWAAVVPLRRGGGTRLKILEALALGTPVVATPKGAEGLGLRDDEHVLLAGTPRDFAEKVVHLLRSPELRARLAANGRQLVKAKYDERVIGRELCALIEQALSDRVVEYVI